MKKRLFQTALLLLTFLLSVTMGVAAQDPEFIQEEAFEESDYLLSLPNGTVEQVQNDDVKIDDISFVLTSTTKYFGLSGNSASRTILFPGKFVAYSHEEGVLLEVYLIKPFEEDSDSEPYVEKGSEQQGGEVYQEGGVWKN